MLYEQYSTAMYSVAYRICGSYDVASDVLQESFILVFRDIHDFKGISTLGRWIKTIVIRTAIRSLKNERVFVTLEETDHDFPLQAPADMDGEHLEQAILTLPDGFRTVFLLVEVEGYSHKEVAAMLGISEGTSKSQLFHSKKRLQKLISQMMQVELKR